MIKPDQVPPEAVEAARKFMCLQALSDEWIDDLLAAALNAWPGMLADGDLAPGENGPPLHLVNAIILPLPPQEASDD